MADLELFKKDRKSAKSTITRYYNWLTKNQNAFVQEDVTDLQAREETLKFYFNKYCKAQDEIEELDENDEENREELENKHYTCIKIIPEGNSWEDNLENILTKFWSIEEIPQKSILSPEDKLAEDIFEKTTKILDDGSYQIDFPFKSPDEHLKLGDSFKIAQKRFLTLENRFKSNPDLFHEYKQFIDEYVELGHAKYVPLTLYNKTGHLKYFIPHLCVIRDSAITTKLRVVFDASAKTSSGFALNNVTLKGYQVQPELFDILCRFRVFKYTLTSDIMKMYRMIKTNPAHNFLQNILWRENPNEDLKCIELQTVTYGTNFAPFIATRVLKDVALKNIDKYPLAANALLKQCYMDDIIGGCDKIEDLFDLNAQLNSLLNSAGFTLHKFNSNSHNLLEYLKKSPSLEYDLNLDKSPSKILGLKWQPTDDCLKISVPEITPCDFPTKRIILSTLAQCFDPLGLVNPIIVKGKILMQKLWKCKVDWDTKISDEHILKEWQEFLEHLKLICNLKIPRCLFSHKPIQKFELHGFADASSLAYGACIYIRTIYEDSVSCSLISSKSKVSPIKTKTIPRLELCAMLLLANLASRIFDIFKEKISFESVNLWSDSEIALAWCKKEPSTWSVFVSNRVAQIQNLTSDFYWRHIKSSENAADILSRGIFTQEILDSGAWYSGPHFLQDPRVILDTLDNPTKIVDLPEEKVSSKKLCCVVTETKSSFQYWNDIFQKFSSITRLKRTLAYVLRFLHNIKIAKNPEQKIKGPLSISELEKAQNLIVKNLQGQYFSKEIAELNQNKCASNKSINSLKPFLDENNFLRVGGRLVNAHISFEQKHPLLLPSHNPTVGLMLKHEHLRLGHSGTQNVLSNFRLQFWPLNGLKETKKIIRQCVTCARFSSSPASQLMANIPKDRLLQVSKPFEKTGIDFGGPFQIKSSRLRKAPIIKGYICVFVCMVTKAIHLEVVTSLSTEAFLMTLKRFISRRGNPSIIYTDNGTNFLGAKNQLKELYDFFNKSSVTNEIKNYLSQNETHWKFIPPKVPHWGGLWEAAVKSTKYHLYRLVGNMQLTYEEFSTILTQIEAILNSRPLCPLSNDPSDFQYLTPSHFLIGSNITAYPEKDISDVPENRVSHWQKCTQIKQLFWKRWSKDYLCRLQNRPKWLKEKGNLKENDLVLLKEDNTPPLYWPRGRILEIFKGPDGRVRVVKIKTKDGKFVRPITKLYPLPSPLPNDG
ncbi:uncharacterized protein LOC126736761 [Anthonomus grandis grandis]|uniref:uncharacterized protein LOC126736761 n=1 Tax=Anthonomus grandis grandis TaxID=2921223 RepID=UPI0021659EFF|nr:uncharacterized protein LOC126736761 [Anthonomus grandis grandis]